MNFYYIVLLFKVSQLATVSFIVYSNSLVSRLDTVSFFRYQYGGLNATVTSNTNYPDKSI